jgi:surface antigen
MILETLAIALKVATTTDVTVKDRIEQGLVVETKAPNFPSPQEISASCDATPACAKAKADAALEADRAKTASEMQPAFTYGNTYASGNCTLYVASRIAVPNHLGNANSWLYGLINAGWRGGEARRGAIAQTYAGWAGHVAVVEEVKDGQVLISEMNYEGYGVISQRWTPISDWNYIYK